MQVTGTTLGWNGYLDWAAELAGLNDPRSAVRPARLGAQENVILPAGAALPQGLNALEPIFVRSVDPGIPTAAFFQQVAAKNLKFDPFEEAFNLGLRRNGQPVEAFLYREKRAGIAQDTGDGLFEILAMGAPVPDDAVPDASVIPDPTFAKAPAALGVIDDGIGILHPRFWKSHYSTRIAAFWAQSLASVKTGAAGETLTAAQIDAMLAKARAGSEEDEYRRLAGRLYRAGTRHSVGHAATHGTLMLDLAAGADFGGQGGPADAMSTIPILAVQVPPQAYDDTSGQRLLTHLLQGLRWLIYQAVKLQIPKLVVNVSLGIVAGPKNGRSFLEQQIAREIARAYPLDVQIVLPYGNAYEDQLVARFDLQGGTDDEIGLRVQPDDRTAGFVEFRLTDKSGESDPARIEVTVTTPDGQTFGGQSVPAGTHLTFNGASGRPMARLYHTPARPMWNGVDEPAYLTLALAPTVELDSDDLTCRPGLWTIRVGNAGTAPMDLVLQVQRDDAPFPRPTGARQAYFDTVTAYGWKPDRLDYTALENGALTHEGTNSAYTTIPHANVHTIGGAWVREARIKPADYAAQGADWSGGAPTASAVSEKTRALPGVLGAGTYAASGLRLSGTSTAAATYSRHLLLAAVGGGGLPTAAVPPAHGSRLDATVVVDSPAIRA